MMTEQDFLIDTLNRIVKRLHEIDRAEPSIRDQARVAIEKYYQRRKENVPELSIDPNILGVNTFCVDSPIGDPTDGKTFNKEVNIFKDRHPFRFDHYVRSLITDDLQIAVCVCGAGIDHPIHPNPELDTV